jgi:hypothetical protein
MIKAVIEDAQGQTCGCTIFPDRWKMVQDRIKQVHSKATFEAGLALSFAGTTNNYEDEIGIIMDDLYNVAMVPSLPQDLKPKKVSLKEAKQKAASLVESIGTPNDSEKLMDDIEDFLYDQGLIDIVEELDD